MKKLIVLMLFLLCLCGCSLNGVQKYNMFYMDTYIEIKLYDTNKKEATNVFKEVDNIFKEYHELSDRYNEYDNVINVYYLNNKLDQYKEIEIFPKLSDLISFGKEKYNETEGYINIALGNVIDVWKKYREEAKAIPTLNELMECGSININDFTIKDNIYKKTSNVKLDLGGYAKGYAVEEVSKYLEEKGYDKYLINAGGNVKVGKKYKLDKYTIGLEEPFNTSNIYKKVYVERNSIVTSGSYQRYYEYEGVNYNHIINPKTLFPENYTKSVTVITRDSSYADILSTFLFLIPIEDGLNLVNETLGVEAIWYVNDDEIYYSEGFNIYE